MIMTTTNETYFDYREKLDRAVELWSGKGFLQTCSDDYKAFAEFIGYPDPEWENGKYIVDHTKPEIRRIIDMITGPHGKTILKILAVQAARHSKSGSPR